MIDHVAAHLALRAKALTLAAVGTGAQSLSATLAGYHRAAGSFLTDGFAVGMEITPAGFVSNPVSVIREITATDIVTAEARTVEAATTPSSLLVGLPAHRSWENVELERDVTRPYLEEEYSPSTSRVLTTPMSRSIIEYSGDYILKWYGLGNTDIIAIRRPVGALMTLFAPGTVLAAGNDKLIISGDPGPSTGQIIPLDSGWSALMLTIPWTLRSRNVAL